MRQFLSFQSLNANSKLLVRLSCIMLSFLFIQSSITAQAKLSIQGIIKRSNGSALEDGVYPIKFNIYAKDNTPAGILWTETIPEVDVNGGIYSEILGNVTALTVPFDQDYTLGIEIGGKEMNPRIELTSAPYALSIRGQSNVFPSAGLVLADNMRVADGILASGGTPGVSGANKNGYSFSGWSDTGLYSTGYGKVSLFCNNTEIVEVTSNGATVNGTAIATTLGANNLNLYNDGGINYSTTNGGSFPGWRLADVDDFSSGTNGWVSHAPLSGFWTAINSTAAGSLSNPNYGTFTGHAITPGTNRQTLKKLFNIPGTFSQVKVKFRYYFLDTWDQGLGDSAYGGFATANDGTSFRMAWRMRQEYASAAAQMNQFATALNFQGQSNVSDHWIDAEMSAQTSLNQFWVYFGAALDSDGNPLDESYSIGHVEIWVR